MGSPVAKATSVNTQDVWKVYWMRADLKWHGYPPAPEVDTLDAFLALVAEQVTMNLEAFMPTLLDNALRGELQ